MKIIKQTLKKIIFGSVFVYVAFLRLILPRRVSLQLDLKLKRIQILEKLDYDKDEIWLDVDSLIENYVRTISCKKEPETVNWIEKYMEPGDVLYDIGANVGTYSLVAAKYHKGNCEVYAFEPGITTFPRLVKNIMLNNCQNIIHPFNIPLGRETKLDTFNYSSLEPGASMHALGMPVDFEGKDFKPVFLQKVLSYSIDDLVRKFDFPFPRHIKLDVDGIELDILEGARNVLTDKRFRSLLVETEDSSPNTPKIIALLEALGFSMVEKHRCALAEAGSKIYNVFNCIFVKKKLL